MSRTWKKRHVRRKQNRGWFKKGPDSRRSGHKFTKEERKRGFQTTLERYPHLGLWLYIKIKTPCTQKGGAR